MFVIRVFYKIALRSHKGTAFTDVAINIIILTISRILQKTIK